MPRLIVLFLILVAVASGAVWFANHPGSVAVEWEGYRVAMPLGLAMAGLILLLAVVAVVYRFWLVLRGGVSNWKTRSRQKRRDKGFKAMMKAFEAVACGEPGEARKQAREAAAALENPSVTLMLTAEAARLEGDEKTAQEYYERMLEHSETEFLGLRGLLRQTGLSGRKTLDLAKRAFELRPKTPWVGQTLFDLQVRAGQWRNAEATLDSMKRNKLLDADALRLKKGLVYFGWSQADRSERGADVEELLEKALEQRPALVPAVVAMAAQTALAGKHRKAAKTIERAWSLMPHPDLYQAYLDIYPDETAETQSKRIQQLIAVNPSALESKVAAAKMALARKDWKQAEDLLKDALKMEHSARICHLLADLAEGVRGNPAAAREWWHKAATAPTGPEWGCTACGHRSQHWHGVCPNCQAVDRYTWRSVREESPVVDLTAEPAKKENENQAADVADGAVETASPKASSGTDTGTDSGKAAS